MWEESRLEHAERVYNVTIRHFETRWEVPRLYLSHICNRVDALLRITVCTLGFPSQAPWKYTLQLLYQWCLSYSSFWEMITCNHKVPEWKWTRDKKLFQCYRLDQSKILCCLFFFATSLCALRLIYMYISIFLHSLLLFVFSQAVS